MNVFCQYRTSGALRCTRLVFSAAVATFCLNTVAEAGTILETFATTLVSQGPSGNPSGSPQVTLYNTDGSVATQPSPTVSQGGAVNWSKPAYVSGDHDLFAGNPLLPADNTTFISFCIELTQDSSFGPKYTVDVIPLASAPHPQSGPIATGMGDKAAGLIEELWAAHFHDIFYAANGKQNDSTTQNSNAAAFQLAIWKLEYDQGATLDFTKGYLQVTDDISDPSVSKASDWLSTIDLQGNGPKANLLAITGHQGINFQDQVIEVLPEPSSMVLWALGALGMAAIGRGRRRGR